MASEATKVDDGGAVYVAIRWDDFHEEVLTSTVKPGGSSKVVRLDGTPGYIVGWSSDRAEADAMLAARKAGAQ